MNHDPPTIADVDPPVTPHLRPPPSYRASIAVASASVAHRSSLQPPPSRAPVEHAYSLFDSQNAPWATLKLLSSVGSPRFLPAYFEGQTVHGALSLDLRKPETILGISVTISGTIVAANAPDPRTFWELTRVLWTSEMGDPHAAGQSASSSSNSNSSPSTVQGKGKNSFKLLGAYSWPFAIALPSMCTVTLRSKQPPVTLPLPPSFSEKGASQFINYEITVRIRRGSLRIDSKLGTHFGFAPRTRPPSPSLLRQLAYQENSPLVGPEGDPDGWTVLPPIVVRGKVFGVRIIEAVCTFAVGLPLIYSRGHAVPLTLKVTCIDTQALDLVFAPQNASVHLIREVCYDNGNSETSHRGSSRGWASGLESTPSDRSLGVTASAASNFGFNPRGFLPRAAPASSSSSPSQATSPPTHDNSSALATTSNITPIASPLASVFSILSSRISKPEKKSKTKPTKVGPKLALHGARTPMTSAVWWPSQNYVPESTTSASQCRCLDGEIMLPRDLVPSFEFGGFSIKYALALLPFQAPGFELFSASPQSQSSPNLSSLPLTSEPLLLSHIDIATLPASPAAAAGSLSRSRAPPGLDVQTQRTAHAERLRKPVVWGLFNQFVNGGSGSRD